tara:strand:- start:987 stop:1478 length:492 start_codon:yes stop_codon:yes gene_type:complete
MCLEDSKRTVKIYFCAETRDEGDRSDFSVYLPNEIQGISILKPCRVWVESSTLQVEDNATDLGEYIFLCSNINQYQSLNTTLGQGNYSNSQILLQYPHEKIAGEVATNLFTNYQNNSGDTAVYCPAGLPSQIRFYLCDKVGAKITAIDTVLGSVSLLLCVQFY